VIERGNELQDKTTMRDRKAVQPNAAEISMQRDAVVEDKIAWPHLQAGGKTTFGTRPAPQALED
jgi:hypothetical protein